MAKIESSSRFLKGTTLAALGVLTLAGCGKDPAKAKPPAERVLPANEAPHGAMTYFGKTLDIDCPRRFDIPARPPGAAVDDVRGLRLGVPYETAIRFAQCRDGKAVDSVFADGTGTSFSRNNGGLTIHESASVATGAFPEKWNYRVNVMDMDLTAKLKDKDALWRMTFDGMPGQERLYAVWLEQPFAQGAQPTLQSQVDALKAKYGPPSLEDTERHSLYWIHLPDGKPAPAFDRDRLRACASSISASNEALSWGPDCGLVVTATVDPAANPLQARAVKVAMFDPAKLWDYQEHHFETERDALLQTKASSESKAAKGGSF
jgi:hypothetical protein